ncbi:Unconventional myosin-XVIIIa [Labeo rohita]|uniref:Unconventional myosin-XVIIIa n=1 Tax=Labeo rohita TaxID=84645 RepID=A0ABQ8M9T7_LABRO|nr:Unconventional myosin-XVIIIa [Labeo rohita]
MEAPGWRPVQRSQSAAVTFSVPQNDVHSWKSTSIITFRIDMKSDSENSMSQSQTAVSGSTERRQGEPSTVVNPAVIPLTVDQRSRDSMNGRHGSIESDALARRGLNLAPKAGSEEKPSTATSVPKTSRPLKAGSSGDGDALSAGLTSLMGRARTKEHRSRSRAAERREPQEESKEKIGEIQTPSEGPQPSTSAISPPPRPDPLAPPVGFLPSKLNPVAKPDPLAPPAGFIPAPKPNPSAQPTPKPDPLAPPSGFIPAPKPNISTETTPKTDPLAPPAGFIPAPKPNSSTQLMPKPDPLAPPVGFVPTPKRDPFAPVTGFIPKPKVDPLAPPAGFIPVPRTTAVRKPEVNGVSKPSAAPAGKLPSQIFTIANQQGSPVMPTQGNQAKAAEDPVALLQAAHEAASLSKVKTEEQLAAEKAWYNTEKVWLVHKDGFSLATQLKTEMGSLPEGKVKVRLEHDGTVLEVDEDDVEKANPLSYDRVEDLSSLLYLNESSILHTLRQRYGGNLIHSYAGPNLLSAYHQLLTTRQDQSIVLLGKSGSGKTTNCQHLLQYLVTIAAGSGKVYSAEKWQAVYTVLEAFGNCSTAMNGNASRFSHIVSLDFDQAGQVASASVQVGCSEGNYLTELHFNHFAENSSFGLLPHSKPEDKQKSAQQFTKLQAAMKVLGISAEEQKTVWLIIGAIYHLGAAGATKAGRKQFARHEWAQKAAYLLGCTLEELSSAIFKTQGKGTLPRSSSVRQSADDTDNSVSKATAAECLEFMASGLYSELFTLIISLINRALKSSQHSLCSLLIVDTPGFQNPRQVKNQRGATFEELCHNYAQERLQTLFQERTFVRELERYKEVRTLSRTDEARGLFWMMEEEVLQPGGSEETLLQRLFSYYGPAEGESTGHTVVLKSENTHHFLLGHSHGTDWLICQLAQRKSISGMFVGRSSSAAVLTGSIAGLEGVSQLAMRRATSMRKTFTTGMAAVKKKSLCLQIKLQVDALMDTVRRSRVHFVHCLLPRAEVPRATGSPEDSCDPGLMQMDVALLRAQIRGFKLLDSLRIYRQGYPDHMVFSEFRRRFDVLAPHLTKKLGRNYIVKDEKRAVEELLESLELEKTSYHMGLSRVFFRAGTVAKLEGQRDEHTRQNITLFQAACRGFLSRQAFKKRKNIKKNRGVKDWPWWKLFTTVRPLVEVQLTEEQIRGKDEEIMHLKLKLEKVEKERNELRLTSDRLESRITELTAELSDERNSAESTSQLLETETSERLRLEKDMKDMQVKFDAVKKQMESMEMEIMEARLLHASELNGEMDNDGDDSGGEWRLKYERAIRDTEFTKKKLQQEMDDKLETEQQNKRHLERKLADLQADQEESQRSVQQLKKKCQRLAAELQDTKLHLENQEGRNHELERKQRKFDVEKNQFHEELQKERNQREKLGRERDMLTGEVFTIRQQLQVRLKIEECVLLPLEAQHCFCNKSMVYCFG